MLYYVKNHLFVLDYLSQHGESAGREIRNAFIAERKVSWSLSRNAEVF